MIRSFEYAHRRPNGVRVQGYSKSMASRLSVSNTHLMPAQNVACSALFLILFIILQGCTSPGARVDQAAAEFGFTRELVQGTKFLHIVYRNDNGHATGPLHIYLEGDGSPYLDRRWVSRDPTPRNPLMLRLMALDPGPSVYLARPCYNGRATTPPCDSALWTQARYSVEVVDSAVAVARQLLSQRQRQTLFLIGHSGGGTLAMLMAAQLPETRAVITIAGNLDTDAWTQYHGYESLRGSLNPARRPPLDRSILQMHLVGKNDDNIPPQMLLRATESQWRTRVGMVEGFDHSCCWPQLWPMVLDNMLQAAESGSWTVR